MIIDWLHGTNDLIKNFMMASRSVAREKNLKQDQVNWIANFTWNFADTVLRNLYAPYAWLALGNTTNGYEIIETGAVKRLRT